MTRVHNIHVHREDVGGGRRPPTLRSPAAGKNRGVACFSPQSMEERRRRGCLLTPLTKLHLPVHTFQPIKLK